MRCLRSASRPTAIVVSDDILALTLERICTETGLSIPADLSILSFNNSLFARLTSPQLTSIDINSCQLGMEAAAQMISHIENPGASCHQDPGTASADRTGQLRASCIT